MGCASSVDASCELQRNEQTRLEDFESGRVLGKGAFSVVRAAVHIPTGERVAIKTVDKQSRVYNSDMIETELLILQRVKHPACMQLSYLFESMESTHIVMDRALGGTLQDRIDTDGALKEFPSAIIVTQLLDGLSHLHAQGICHRDVKPLNILMLSCNRDSPRYNSIKLTDYGLAAIGIGDYVDCMDMVCGTPMYAAPEMLRIAAEQCKQKYSSKVDVWSAGCTLYAMLSGASPFQEYSGRTIQMVQTIVAGKYKLEGERWIDVTFQAKGILCALMQLDPSTRPTAKEAKNKSRIWATASRRRERAKGQMIQDSWESRNESEVSFASTISHDGSVKYLSNISCDAASVQSLDGTITKIVDFAACKIDRSRSNVSATPHEITSDILLEDSSSGKHDVEPMFVLSRNEA